MARRGILSHKLRKFFRKAKLASRAYGAPFAKNPTLRPGFSGLLRLPPQSPNTQNSSAATPRPGADVRKNLSIKYSSKESEKRKLEYDFLKKKRRTITVSCYSSAFKYCTLAVYSCGRRLLKYLVFPDSTSS